MKYFTIGELTESRTATLMRLDNTPNKEIELNLIALINQVLDPAREKLKEPITVTSGYRSPDLNRIVRGAKNSQHMKGEAADIICRDNKKLFDILKEGDFDQLIWEKGNSLAPKWIHVSFKRDGHNRKQILKM